MELHFNDHFVVFEFLLKPTPKPNSYVIRFYMVILALTML